MSRFKIFASVIPLILAGVFARESLSPRPQPCIRVGNVAVQMATAPWQSQSRVSFTNNPAEATVRVALSVPGSGEGRNAEIGFGDGRTVSV